MFWQLKDILVYCINLINTIFHSLLKIPDCNICRVDKVNQLFIPHANIVLYKTLYSFHSIIELTECFLICQNEYKKNRDMFIYTNRTSLLTFCIY
jgi:hypothetical protein